MTAAPPTDHFNTAAARLRAERATTLALALADCHPQDADQIIAAWLAERLTTGPEPAFGAIRDDAAFWAETAPQVEVQEYVWAGVKVLADKAMGQTARQRFLALLWNGMAADDRRAFLQRVTAQ